MNHLVNVIGLGYIGLPTALMLAVHGVKVIGSDNNPQRISDLENGNLVLNEEGMAELLAKARKAGIQFTDRCCPADIYIVSVPTPYDKDSKKVDAAYVVNAVRSLLAAAPENAVIVIESTVSPGTIHRSITPVLENAGREDLRLAHAPERIIPGNMLYELEQNNRTIGADDRDAGEIIRSLYSTFCKGKIILTDIRTAEMTKVVENTFRAVNIAFANELARICQRDAMDIYEIIRICNMHPRVNILQPGPGVGGHCISVDPWFLVGDYPGLARVINEAMKTNEAMPDYVLERIGFIMRENGITDTARVGLYGLTYKENVDDTRESPTLQLLESQKRHLAAPLKVYDPYVRRNVVENQVHDLDEFLRDTDLVVIMVKHDEIKKNQHKLEGKIVLDCQNICDIQGVYHL